MTVVVVGIDLSLTSTGIARIDRDADTITTSCVTSKGRADATLPERGRRLVRLLIAITAQVPPADLVVVESPSFGQARQGGQHDRAGLWWLVVEHLHARGYPVAEVAPAARAKYATGKGNAAKDAVLAAVVRRYPGVDVTGNDQADALILAAMGARHLSAPVDELPKAHLEAMVKVQWLDVFTQVGAA